MDRERFEAAMRAGPWARVTDATWNALRNDVDENGQYESTDLEGAWLGWQAALAQPAPAAEPVAYTSTEELAEIATEGCCTVYKTSAGNMKIALYTSAPPVATATAVPAPVELSDERIHQIHNEVYQFKFLIQDCSLDIKFARAVLRAARGES